MRRHTTLAFLVTGLLAFATPVLAQENGDEDGGMMDAGSTDGAEPAAAPAGEDSGESGSASGSGATHTDILHLKDGRVLKGHVTAEDDDAWAVRIGSTIRVVPKADVERMEKGPPEPEAATGPAVLEVDAGKRSRTSRASTPAVTAWIKECLSRSLDDDPTVRRSAAAALTSLGDEAVPAIEAALADAEGPRREMLERLLEEAKKAGRKADDRKRPEDDFRAMAGRLARSLELTADQRGVFARAFGTYLKDARAVVEELQGGFIGGDEAVTKAAALRTSLHTALEGTLDESQMTRMEELLDRYSRRIGAGKAPAPPRAGGRKPEGKGRGDRKREGKEMKPGEQDSNGRDGGEDGGEA